jgi:ammonia channel protein AmtB
MFKEQVALGSQVETIYYILPCLALLIGIGALMMIDSGLSTVRNTLYSAVQKLIMACAGMFGMALVGYGIWQWQYYKAFGIAEPLKEAIGDWGLFGTNLTTLPQHLDPKIVPAADQLQLFFIFFVLFAGLAVTVLQVGFAERMKLIPSAIVALIFGALIVPIYGYLTYGSVGPLSNAGLHDFAGIFAYVVIGTWSVIFAWRVGPRRGAFDKDPSKRPIPSNLLLTTIGIVFFLVALLGYMGGNGFLLPDQGFFGVHLNESGVSFTIAGTVTAYIGALISGTVLWRLTGQLFMLLISPVAGYVAVSGCVDVAKPWEAGVVGLIAPLAVYLVSYALQRLRIDDSKIGPLALGAGIWGALATGIVGAGDKVGGYPGLTGAYELGHTTISFGQQLFGVGVFLAGGFLSALILAFLLEKTIGLRVSDEDLDRGLDQATFGVDAHHLAGLQAPPAPAPAPAAAGSAGLGRSEPSSGV